jgi:membrane-bound metal-dependent hydrolase YbcI (DUF457 family)
MLPDRAAAEAVADALVRVMGEAFAGQPRRVIAHTVRVNVDCWRRYTIALDSGTGTLIVRMGPLVTTGGVSLPGQERPPDSASSEGAAVRKLNFPLAGETSREYDVDIFNGPSFTFRREGTHLRVDFLDWHHRWTHSLTLAVATGLVLGLGVMLAWGNVQGRWAALVAMLGAAAHVLEDQLGHMGCNLLWPLTRERTPGPGLLHAGDPIPNFLVVWTSLAVILYNLDRFGGPGLLSAGTYLPLVVGLPWLLLGSAHLLSLRKVTNQAAGETHDVGDFERRAEAEAPTE